MPEVETASPFATEQIHGGSDAYLDHILEQLGYGVVGDTERAAQQAIGEEDAIQVDFETRRVALGNRALPKGARRQARRHQLEPDEERFIVIPRPSASVRIISLGLIVLLAGLTLVAALVAQSVRDLTGGIRDTSPVLEVSIIHQPMPTPAELMDDPTFDRLVGEQSLRAGDLYLARAGLLADDERWDEAVHAFQMARDYGAVAFSDTSRLRWAEALVATYRTDEAQDLLRGIDLTQAEPQVREATLAWLDRIDERQRRR